MTFDATHPFHLHGSSFRVVAMERIASYVTVDQIRAMDENGLIRRNLVFLMVDIQSFALWQITQV